MAGPRLLDPHHKVGRAWLTRAPKAEAQTSLEAANRAAKKVPAPKPDASPVTAALNVFQHHVARAAAYQGLELPAATKNALVDALIASASKALEQQGVKHEVVARTATSEPTLVISVTGDHALNRRAAMISREYQGIVRYAPADLVGTGWAATYNPATNSLGIDHGQILAPDTLSNSFKHEQIHMESDFAIRSGQPWATSGYLLGIDEGVLPQAVAGLENYRAFQSIDELPAYLVSLEHAVERGVAAPDAAELKSAVEELRYDTVNLLDVAFRAEGVLRRAGTHVQRGTYEFWSDKSGRSVDIKETRVAEHAHEVLLPQEKDAPAETELEARLAAATTHLAMARLSQTVIDTLPADANAAKAMLGALGEMFRAVIADRRDGKLRLTFPQAVARFNASLRGAAV